MAARKMGNHRGLPLQFVTLLASIQLLSGLNAYSALKCLKLEKGNSSTIQLFQDVLDPGFRRVDDWRDFLRNHQFCLLNDLIPLGAGQSLRALR